MYISIKHIWLYEYEYIRIELIIWNETALEICSHAA